MCAEAGQSLVDRVVDYFIYEVMQAFDAYVADIHGRAFPYRLQAFEHLNVAGAILLRCFLVQVKFFFRHKMMFYNV